MANNYPIKMLRDEEKNPFVPFTYADAIADSNGVTLQELMDNGKYKIQNNVTTASSGLGVLDAYQGKLLNEKFNNYILESEKGVANGVATLGGDGKVPSGQLPSFVDDVIEAYTRSGATPLSASWLSLTDGGAALTPETGKIYVVMSSGSYQNKQYRWGGSTYVLCNPSDVNSVNGFTGVVVLKSLKIQKNGTQVGSSFNGTTDTTVNLAIPTKTSDITNDSGFITANDDINGNAATATNALNDSLGRQISSTYVTLAGDEQITGKKDFAISEGLNYSGIAVGATNKSYNLWFSDPSKKGVPVYNTSLSYNPNTNILTAGTFNGALTGNATSATTAGSATNDSLGNNISTTYVKKAGDTMSGSLSYNDTTGTTFIKIGSNNKDTTLMRVYSSDQAYAEKGTYGFSFKYLGTGTGNDNKFTLLADNGTSATQVEAFNVAQDGTITVGKTIVGKINRAIADEDGNNIKSTYETKANAITGLSVSGRVITYTKGNGTTGTITTQDTVYTLPTATTTRLGGIKVGNRLQATDDGVLSVLDGGTADYVEWSGVLNKPTNVSYWTNDAAYITLANVMAGASANADGARGVVPKPVAGDQNKYLRGDGQWAQVDYAATAGSATSATSATKDSAGNVISDTYVTKGTDQTITGKKTFSTAGGIKYTGIETATTDAARAVWFSDSATPGTPVINASKFTYNPSTDTLKVGNVTGNAATATSATKATQDSDGNAINTTYLKKSGGTMTGPLSFNNGTNKDITWIDGTYQQKIKITDDSIANTAVFEFQQSTDSGSTWPSLMTIKDNGEVVATKFTGALNGNATSATTAGKATNDSDGNAINTTYLKKSGGTMTGELVSPRNNFIYSGNEFNFVSSSFNANNIHFNYRGNDLNNTATAIQDYYFDNGQKTSSGVTLHASSFTGNSATASKLQTARTIALGTAVDSTATSFDGSANITIPVNFVKEAYLSWGGRNLSGSVSPLDAALNDEFSANRLAYLPANDITIEYSRDGGSTWTNYSTSDDGKVKLVTTSYSYYTGGTDSAAGSNYQLRVTIAPGNHLYMNIRKLFLYISTGGVANAKVTIDRLSMGGSTYTNIGTYDINGWSGWNSIPVSMTYGGTANWSNSHLRLTFFYNGKSESYPNAQLNLMKIRLHGETAWNTPGTMAQYGRLYDIDWQKNAIFPAEITATKFNGLATKATGDKNGLDITNYIKGLSISGKTITYTKGDNTTGTITTQDTIYTLPIAGTGSSGTLGGVKVGSGLSIDSGTGVLSATGGGTADNVEWSGVLNKPTNVSYWTNDAGYTTNTGTITGVSVNGTSVATSGVANITSMPASILSGAIPSAVTATTQTTGDNSTKIATTAFVQNAVSSASGAMVFKGTIGTGGTAGTTLPTTNVRVGDTYKIITAGTYAGQAAKAGDLFIATATTPTWAYVPSGDEPSGTVTSVTIKATGPIAIDSSSAITTSGERTISHANSGVTAGTYRSVTVNATGHVTAGTNPTTLSGYGITDAKIANGTITLGSNTITPLTSHQDISGKLDKSGGTMTGNLTMAGRDINLTTSGSSSDDSGDIAWYYGNGQEKARLWTANEYTSELGLNYRQYKKDGTVLFNGTIPLRDTKNTAGSADSSSKLFIIGAPSQSDNPVTYSQDTTYVGTDGHLYSNSKQVVNLSDTQALTNKTYNGYTLAAASAKGVDTSISAASTSANLPTSAAVASFVEGKGYVTTDTKNTAGSTDTSSKIFLIGATSQAANPQTYSDDQVYVTSGTLQANILNSTTRVNANTALSGTAGGLALYGTNADPSQYGVTMRNTGTTSGNLGKHGYVQGDWAGYFCFDGATNRGWVFRQAGNNVASVSGTGNAVFNGSITVGGNIANTSGARIEYNSTDTCIEFNFV